MVEQPHLVMAFQLAESSYHMARELMHVSPGRLIWLSASDHLALPDFNLNHLKHTTSKDNSWIKFPSHLTMGIKFLHMDPGGGSC